MINFLSNIMKKTKEIFGQIHLYLGLVSGLVVFIVSLTGCLYVIEEINPRFMLL